MDIGAWLRTMGLGPYEAAFRDNAIDVDVLADLTDSDLEKLGLPLSDRKRLLKALAGFSGSPSAPTKLESSQARPPRPAAPSTSAERLSRSCHSSTTLGRNWRCARRPRLKRSSVLETPRLTSNCPPRPANELASRAALGTNRSRNRDGSAP
jgi:hypothetical protein